MKPELLADKYWKDRQKAIQELKSYDVPITVIGNMKEQEQTLILQKLKDATEVEIKYIIEMLKKNYEDK